MTGIQGNNRDDMSSSDESDEPIVELLDRERRCVSLLDCSFCPSWVWFVRQWQAEREKLIQCIHLQQLELAQRNLAAQERAVDIAKVTSPMQFVYKIVTQSLAA